VYDVALESVGAAGGGAVDAPAASGEGNENAVENQGASAGRRKRRKKKRSKSTRTDQDAAAGNSIDGASVPTLGDTPSRTSAQPPNRPETLEAASPGQVFHEDESDSFADSDDVFTDEADETKGSDADSDDATSSESALVARPPPSVGLQGSFPLSKALKPPMELKDATLPEPEASFGETGARYASGPRAQTVAMLQDAQRLASLSCELAQSLPQMVLRQQHEAQADKSETARASRAASRHDRRSRRNVQFRQLRRFGRGGRL
jgi:hypothetical protein